jgi:hypothetical protein
LGDCLKKTATGPQGPAGLLKLSFGNHGQTRGILERLGN